MREFPIFVPFEGGALAAVVAVPDGDPRALVLLLQGLGAPRSHRFRVWTRTARHLAERGFASVRFDYPQIGDSTGTMRASMHEPPVKETLAVARAAMRAVGVTTCAAVGNCMGGMTALKAVPNLDLRAVGVVLSGDLWKHFVQGHDGPEPTPPTVALAGLYRRLRHRLRSALRPADRERLVAAVYGSPGSERQRRGSTRRQRRRRRGWMPGHRVRWIPEVHRVAEGASLMLMYLGPAEVGVRLARAARGLGTRGARPAPSVDVSTVPTDRMDWPHVMTLQQRVVDTVVEWLDRAVDVSAGGDLDHATGTTVTRETQMRVR